MVIGLIDSIYKLSFQFNITHILTRKMGKKIQKINFVQKEVGNQPMYRQIGNINMKRTFIVN